jgi:hypothetical protein
LFLTTEVTKGAERYKKQQLLEGDREFYLLSEIGSALCSVR